MADVFSFADVAALAPFFSLIAGALLALLWQVILPGDRNPVRSPGSFFVVHLGWWFALLFALAGNGSTGGLLHPGPGQILFAGQVEVNPLSDILQVTGLITGYLLLLWSSRSLRPELAGLPELPVLLSFSAAGAVLLVQSSNWITFFLAIELASLPVFILNALNRERRPQAEAAMKYFLISVAGTGILIFGIALIYGATGSLSLTDLRALTPSVSARFHGIGLAGIILVFIALWMKAGLAPFHQWAIDVYSTLDGWNASVLASLSKFTAIVSLFRVWQFAPASEHVTRIFLIIIVLSILIGNAGGLRSIRFNKAMAFSSLAQSAVLLIPLAVTEPGSMTATQKGFLISGIVLYLMVYLPAAAQLYSLSARYETLESAPLMSQETGRLNKLGFIPAVTGAVSLLSLAGIPPVMGFWSKLMILRALVSPVEVVAVLVLIAGFLLAVWYYVRPALAILRDVRLNRISWDQATLADGFVLAWLAMGIFISGTVYAHIFQAVQFAR